MKIESIYDVSFPEAAKVLYDLLAERTPEQSISHKKMPTFNEHQKFILSTPYAQWYLIQFGGHWVGSMYITKQNEIGISIFNSFQGQGHGSQALRRILDKYQGQRMLANINPKNENSIKLFESMGFKPIQITYELS